MRRFLRSERGFTLAEILVEVGILTIFLGTIGGALYQAMGSQRGITDDGMAIFEQRKALSWFSGDAKMAKTTTLVDGAQPVSSVSFSWTDQYQGAGTAHTASYLVVGDTLVRTYDGQSHVVAQGVVSASFSLAGQVPTIQLVVTAKPGTTRPLSTSAFIRTAP